MRHRPWEGLVPGEVVAYEIVVVAAGGDQPRQGLEVFGDMRFATAQRRVDIGGIPWLQLLRRIGDRAVQSHRVIVS